MTAISAEAMPGNVGQFTLSSNSYISATSSPALKTFSALTLEAWIKPNVAREWALIMGKQYNPGDGNPWYSYRLCKSNSGTFPDTINFNIAPVSTGGEAGVTSTTVVQNNIWTHVAGVYDGTTIKIYINGTLENTVNQTGNLKESDLPMYIGKAPWTNYNNFNGQMDELRVWNIARTQAQIQYAMNRSLEGNEEGLVAYWPFNDVAGSPTADDASQYNHVGTLYNGAAIAAGSTVPLNMDFIAQTGMPLSTVIVSNPITVSGSPAAISITNGEYSISTDSGSTWSDWTGTAGTVSLNKVKVRQTSSASYSTLTTATLNIGGANDEFFNVTTAASNDPNASGLIAWWKAEDNAYDSVGGNHGTALGGTTYATGQVGEALSVDGVNGSYVSVPDNISLRITGDITVSAFIKRTGLSNGSYGHILTKGAATIGGVDVSSAYLLQIDGADHLVGGFERLDGSNAVLTGPEMIDLSRFHHIGYARAGTSHTLYVDGAEVATGVYSGVPGDTTGLALTIGAVTDNTGHVDVFNGLIDEVKIFSRALSALEISTLAGTVPDAFTFDAQTGVPLSTPIESDAITVTGINYPTSISITGGDGQYAISTDNGSTWGDWTNLEGTVSLNNQVKVHQTSSANYSALTTVKLTIGGVEGTFSVTTMPIPVYSLTITKTGSGTVTCSPNPVDHGSNSTCTVTPDVNYHIVSVTVDGGGQTIADPKTFSYQYTNVTTAGHAISATFAIDQYTVTTTAVNGTITSAIHPSVGYGSATTVTGSANTGYYFSSVSGCNGTEQTNTLPSVTTFSYLTGTITGVCTVTASFSSSAQQVTVTNTRRPGVQTGRITSEPVGIDCPGVCQYSFTYNGPVVLTASEIDVCSYLEWTDSCSGNGHACNLTMNNPKGVTATFNLYPPVMISGSMAPYTDLPDAYPHVQADDVVEMQTGETAIGDLDLNGPSMTLSGGFDCSYDQQNGDTMLAGNITISGGAVIVDRIVIK